MHVTDQCKFTAGVLGLVIKRSGLKQRIKTACKVRYRASRDIGARREARWKTGGK